MTEDDRRILPERTGAFLRWCNAQQPGGAPSWVVAAAVKDRSWPVQSSKLSVLLTACSNLDERLNVKRAHNAWRRAKRDEASAHELAKRPDLIALAERIRSKRCHDCSRIPNGPDDLFIQAKYFGGLAPWWCWQCAGEWMAADYGHVPWDKVFGAISELTGIPTRILKAEGTE